MHEKWYNTHKRDEREKERNGAGEVFGCIPHGTRVWQEIIDPELQCYNI